MHNTSDHNTSGHGSTVIVNMRHEKCDVRCDRASIFGNPFKIGIDGTRVEVVDKYGRYFAKKIRDQKFKNQVLLLKGKKLGCWCAPDRCHLEWIVAYLESYE